MVDYKKYIQVLEILKSDIKRDLTGGSSIGDFSDCTDEQKASAICELFDTQKTFIIGNTPTVPPKLYDLEPFYNDLTATQC